MLANIRAVRDYTDFLKGRNRDKIRAILAAYTELPPEIVDQVGWPPIDPDGRLNLDSMMSAQEYMLERGTIRQILPAEQIVDQRFVEYAVQQLGPYRG
jgi:NitT/TauT family transport system substrate-binding protein